MENNWKWVSGGEFDNLPKELLIDKIESLRSIIKVYQNYNKDLEGKLESIPSWVRGLFGAKYFNKIENG